MTGAAWKAVWLHRSSNNRVQRLQPVRKAGCHRQHNTQRFLDEAVEHQRADSIVELIAERMREPGEAAVLHPNGQVQELLQNCDTTARHMLARLAAPVLCSISDHERIVHSRSQPR